MSETPVEALARALHDNDEICNAAYYLPFEDCANDEWDRQHAAEVMDSLRSAGWVMIRRPEGMDTLGIEP